MALQGMKHVEAHLEIINTPQNGNVRIEGNRIDVIFSWMHLAPTNAVTTMLYVADEENVVEMVPQIPGQFGIAGTEQEAPPALKLVKFA